MTHFEYDFMTKAQVDGCKELIDLCANGYIVVFSSTVAGVRYYKLKHCRNGRTLMMMIGRYIYELKESGKVLKRQIYEEDSTTNLIQTSFSVN